MKEYRGYGEKFGQALAAERASCIYARTLRQTEIAVTEVAAENPEHRLSDPIPPQDAFIVALQLRDYPEHKFWENGRHAPLAALHAGCTTIYDLKRNPIFLINGPFHSVHFYLPRAALDAIADEAEAPRIEGLRYTPGAGVDDPVLRGLGLAIGPALERPEQADRLFVTSVLLAVATHVTNQYGGMSTSKGTSSGGLAPWQRRRAEAILDANLNGHLPLALLAGECGLSPSHFARAFRRSFGLPPHRWLVERRIDRAKTLLAETSLPLAEVAPACGFADQSHFTRVFSARVGITPGAWRRTFRT